MRYHIVAVVSARIDDDGEVRAEQGRAIALADIEIIGGERAFRGCPWCFGRCGRGWGRWRRAKLWLNLAATEHEQESGGEPEIQIAA